MLISIVVDDCSRIAINKNHIISVDLTDKRVTIRTVQSSVEHVSNTITCSSPKVALMLYEFIVSSNYLNSTFDFRKLS